MRALVTMALALTVASLAHSQEARTDAATLQAGCDAGHPADCRELGRTFYDPEGVSRVEGELYASHPEKALPLFRRACDGGDAQACAALGWMYAGGHGVSRDDVQAAQLFRQACDRGDAQGCGGLARAYDLGLGVPQDKGRAREL